MDSKPRSTPLERDEVLDLYFLDARCKLIEIAAFVDRVQRAAHEHEEADGAGDEYRLEAFKRAVAALADERSDKARRVQMIFSDPTDEPLASARGMKGASGAYRSKERR